MGAMERANRACTCHKQLLHLQVDSHDGAAPPQGASQQPQPGALQQPWPSHKLAEPQQASPVPQQADPAHLSSYPGPHQQAAQSQYQPTRSEASADYGQVSWACA